MSLLAVDLGGTKLAVALFSEAGAIKSKNTISLNGRSGKLVGELICNEISALIANGDINAVGVAVPGIYSKSTGKVWAPNIAGWSEYPLLEELKVLLPETPVVVESDRSCYISGEVWNGNAKGCTDAIFLAVGTGIGAGIMSGGNIIRGAQDIAGAVGWMALDTPFQDKYIGCGCFEYHASGEGIGKVYSEKFNVANGQFQNTTALSALDVFKMFEESDHIASTVINECIMYWGMAAANLVSIFNPQKVIFGGGVFGPAKKFLEQIKHEALKWGQPISMQHVEFTTSALGNDAGLYGAAYLALQSLTHKSPQNGL